MQANTGRGMQLQLLDWLEELTFPEESKFEDVEYAKMMYASAVDRYLRSGTTTACIYATLHLEGRCRLVDATSYQGSCRYLPRAWLPCVCRPVPNGPQCAGHLCGSQRERVV